MSRQFKIIKASASSADIGIINLLSAEPHLLAADFEINGKTYQVMVDTGATISCVPEHGQILRSSRAKLSEANLIVELANGGVEHVDKKTKVFLRPAGSTVQPKPALVYVTNGVQHLFGFHALLGLKHLKLFELNILVRDGRIIVCHQNRVIGCESPGLTYSKFGVKVIDNIVCKHEDSHIQRIVNKYKSVFTDLDVNPIRGPPMRFLTVHNRAIFAKQRHYTPEEALAMKEHTNILLAKGIIEPTDSGYAATSRIIPKKNGTGRLVVNYIPLNAVTYRDSYALPHVADILRVIQGNEYLSTLDCTQGFYQINVDPRDRHKTAFSTPTGNYQFTRCPFGARNSCAVFQANMNRIFSDGLFSRCVIYVDDVLVFGRTREEHDQNLEWVLRKCAEYHVKIKLEKCCFAKREVQYLGFIVSGRDIKPIPEKVTSISKTKPPRDKTELRSVIGKLNFYSRFIPNYSKQLEPLRSLLTNYKDYQWTEFHQQAFEGLLSHLERAENQLLVSSMQPKVISLHIMSDSLETLLLTTDNKLVMRASRLLSAAELNYSSIEKLLLALTFALHKFRLLIDPQRVTIRVPNNGIEKVYKMTNRPERVDRLLLQMPPGFDELKFEVDTSLISCVAKDKSEHVPEEIYYVDGACKANGKPDCRASWAVCAEFEKDFEAYGIVEENPSNQSAELTAAIKACKIAKTKGFKCITIVTDSKYLHSAVTVWIDKWKNNEWKDNKNKPVINMKLFKQLIDAKSGLDIHWIHVKGHADSAGNIRVDLLARSLLDQKVAILNAMSDPSNDLQQDCDEIGQLKEKIRQNPKGDLQIIDEIVYFIDKRLPDGSQKRVYVPTMSRHLLLNLAHDDSMYGGHLGIKKTFRKLIRFWWPKIHKDVENYVKSCDLCQKFKNPAGLPPGYLNSIPVSKVFQHVHIDIVGPLKPTVRGHKYVITATDAFSKWAFAQPSQGVRTSEVIRFVEDNILSIHGKPTSIISDRGSQFTSTEWNTFINKLGIEHKMTASYHPQANGIDERLNGTLMRILRSYVDELQDSWDEHLKWSLYVYNTTVHESTGYSPYQVLHGLDSRSPLKPVQNSSADETEIEQVRSVIREDVLKRNEQAQAINKKYYDRHRQDHNLHIGQLVLVRIHVAPTWLSKKFYIKWDGPFVIINFVGNRENARAVTVFDYQNMTKKVVTISDVKPYTNTYDRPNQTVNLSKEGDGHTLVDSCDSQTGTDSSFYAMLDINDGKQVKAPDTTSEHAQNNEPSPQQEDHNDDLDITHYTTTGPLTSSPRRVTINTDVTTRTYERQESTQSDTDQDTIIQPSVNSTKDSPLPDIAEESETTVIASSANDTSPAKLVSSPASKTTSSSNQNTPTEESHHTDQNSQPASKFASHSDERLNSPSESTSPAHVETGDSLSLTTEGNGPLSANASEPTVRPDPNVTVSPTRDNTRKDPTYKPPPNQTNIANMSGYNLRSHARRVISQSSSVKSTNNEANSSSQPTVTQPTTPASQIRRPMQNAPIKAKKAPIREVSLDDEINADEEIDLIQFDEAYQSTREDLIDLSD